MLLPFFTVFCSVPFSAKDAVKALGGKWNPTDKSWEIPSSALPAAAEIEGARFCWFPKVERQTAAALNETIKGLPRADQFLFIAVRNNPWINRQTPGIEDFLTRMGLPNLNTPEGRASVAG